MNSNKIVDEIKLYIPNNKEENAINNTKEQNELNINANRVIENVKYQKFLKLSEHYYSYYSYNFINELKSNENFQRIDWVYSENHNKI